MLRRFIHAPHSDAIAGNLRRAGRFGPKAAAFSAKALRDAVQGFSVAVISCIAWDTDE
jgi:hypothetical protein